MRFSTGCLLGLLLGVLLSVLAIVGYTLVNPSDNLPLSPVSSGAQTDLTITVGQQYLNERVRQDMATRGMGVTDLNIELHAPNRAEAVMSMSISVLGEPLLVHPRAYLHFGLTKGLVSFEIDRVDISGFSVPQDVVDKEMGTFKQSAQAQLNSELKQMLLSTGLHVVSVEATEGAAIIKLSR